MVEKCINSRQAFNCQANVTKGSPGRTHTALRSQIIFTRLWTNRTIFFIPLTPLARSRTAVAYLPASLLPLAFDPFKSACWTRPVKLAICCSIAFIRSLQKHQKMLLSALKPAGYQEANWRGLWATTHRFLDWWIFFDFFFCKFMCNCVRKQQNLTIFATKQRSESKQNKQDEWRGKKKSPTTDTGGVTEAVRGCWEITSSEETP